MDRKRIAIALVLLFVLVITVILIIKNNKCKDEKKPYYNEKTKKCEVCPRTTPKWDKTKKKCVACDSGKVWNGTQCVTEPADNTDSGDDTEKCQVWLNENCLMKPKPNDFVYYKNEGEDFYRTAQYTNTPDGHVFKSYDKNITNIDNSKIVEILDSKKYYITNLNVLMDTDTKCGTNQLSLIKDLRKNAGARTFTLCGNLSENPTMAVTGVKPTKDNCNSPFEKITAVDDINRNYFRGLMGVYSTQDSYQTTCVKKEVENKKPGLFVVQGDNDKADCPTGSMSIGSINNNNNNPGYRVYLAEACVPN